MSKRFAVGLLLSAAFITVFLIRTNIGDTWVAIKTANYLYVIPGIALYFMSLLWRTWRWKIILSPMGDFRVFRLWPVVTVGYAANNVLPARLGEVVRAYFLNLRERVSKASALATILIERVSDGLALLLLVGVVSLYVPIVELFKDLGAQARVNWLVLTLGLSVPFFSFAVLLVSMAVWPEVVERAVRRALHVLPERFRPAASFLSTQFMLGLSSLRHPRRLCSILALSVPVWLFEASMFLLVALGFDLDESFSSIWRLAGVLILTTATANLGTTIPAGGGGVGPFEFFAQATLVYFAVDVGVATAYVLVVHAALLVPVTIVGFTYAWLSNNSLAGLARSGAAAGEAPSPAAGGA